jgi:hypothetical protein
MIRKTAEQSVCTKKAAAFAGAPVWREVSSSNRKKMRESFNGLFLLFGRLGGEVGVGGGKCDTNLAKARNDAICATAAKKAADSDGR